MSSIKKFVQEFAELCDAEVTEEMTELAKKFYKSCQKTKKEPTEEKKEKKKPNSYILFCMGERQRFIDENEDKKPKEITQIMAASWKEEKSSNSELYQKYVDQYNSDDDEKPKKKAKKVESDGEVKEEKKKREPSAYNVFCSLERQVIKEEHPDMENKEYMTELGKRWKKLTAEQKAEYKGKDLSPKKDKKVPKVPPPPKKQKAQKEEVPDAPPEEEEVPDAPFDDEEVPDVPSDDEEVIKKPAKKTKKSN
jgi:HMG (high mobility group) box